jgi:hypothetical protein
MVTRLEYALLFGLGLVFVLLGLAILLYAPLWPFL